MVPLSTEAWTLIFGICAVVLVGIIIAVRLRKRQDASGASAPDEEGEPGEAD
ncbi:MAG: hypothetical protein ACYS1C_12780 [Planctomycetota bacterium]|jgi:hypothetical protein